MKMPFSFVTTEIAIVVIGAIVGGVSVTSAVMVHSANVDSARVEFTRALDSVNSAALTGRRQLASARKTVSVARKLLASSAGHTADESARTQLERHIATADGVITAAKRELNLIARAGSKRLLTVASLESVRAATKRLENLRLRALHAVAPAMADVASSTTAVGAAVTSWTTAQKAAAAAQAAAAMYTENVWTSGFQAQLNECKGAVNLTGSYGVRTIGEKWNCGGARFPRTGSLVRFTGVVSGVYRVGGVVAMLNAYVNGPKDIPRGYELLYQTCLGNDPRKETFTELTLVG